MGYYHLSPDDSIHKLVPHVPHKIWNGHEDDYVERICFSDSINGCLRALFAGDGAKYSVYTPKSPVKVYSPSAIEVIDQSLTNEVWVTDEIEVVKIGSITVLGGDVVDTVLLQELDIQVVNFRWQMNRPIHRLREDKST